VVGVIGLGTMGSRVASHLARSGVEVVGYDLRPPAVEVPGLHSCADVESVARRAEVCVFSLPDASAALACARAVAQAPGRRTTHVVDLSTVGTAAARTAAELLSVSGVGYVDSPVSGSLAAAASGQLALMVAAPQRDFVAVQWLLELVGGSVAHVGEAAGLGQAMKVINNAISGTTLAVTSEALAVGTTLGLDLATMLEVVNSSSGRSVASDRKFPEQVVTGAYAHGGPGAHFDKDIGLFLELAQGSGVTHRLATESASLWHQFAHEWAGADQTEIFPYLRGDDRPAL
jgi:3-hydroxyisobutyrate dehydrogenase